eukprot:7173820-Pyramimonas_sp.AAC.1
MRDLSILRAPPRSSAHARLIPRRLLSKQPRRSTSAGGRAMANRGPDSASPWIMPERIQDACLRNPRTATTPWMAPYKIIMKS